MKRKLFFVVIIIVMASAFFLTFTFFLIKPSKNELSIQYGDEQPDIMREVINKDDQIYLNEVLEKNGGMIREYLKNCEDKMKWFDISFYDFTGDGKREIILSRTHLEGYLTVISYNYVYDQSGDKLFEFISGSAADVEIYNDNDNKAFYLQTTIDWGANNNITLYSKFVKKEGWEKKILISEWDMRQTEQQNNTEENYYIFHVSPEKEQQFVENMFEEMIKLREEKNLNMDQFNIFLLSYDNLEKNKMEAYGSIYCLENQLVLEIAEERFIIEGKGTNAQLLNLDRMGESLAESLNQGR